MLHHYHYVIFNDIIIIDIISEYGIIIIVDKKDKKDETHLKFLSHRHYDHPYRPYPCG